MFVMGDMESMIAANELLRLIRRVLDEILRRLDGNFAQRYAPTGRSSIAVEQLMLAQALMPVERIRSERQLMKYIQYHTLFRWFFGIVATDSVLDVTVFTTNRSRRLEHDIRRRVLIETVAIEREDGFISDHHLAVAWTNIQA